jgi:transcription elongation factor Elf1
MGAMKGSTIKEHVCPACNGTGYPVVMQPVQPGRKIYPVKCKVCDAEVGGVGAAAQGWAAYHDWACLEPNNF